ncbi:cysteine hydrolase family protein [Legionella bozemanae]|uniref:Isochorismatase n=1 Tax=Legionella bozemanae TaxID=447 RepID=A0A0W0RJ52_LEGBO|nr:isochorismatase family cysteine hydrolase [Legionella bozemanae]KTC71091.1 isochorismatase [Legionella bozemanae]STO33224.1 Isochorismatase family protein yecD [Legionella bozemanae]
MMCTAFIGLDYIIDIMHPQGKIARSASHAQERDVIKKVNKVLEIAQLKNWLAIMVKVGFSAHYIEQPKHSPIFGKVHQLGALQLGSEGTEFHPELQIGDSLVIVKPRISAFYGTALDAALRANQIERLIIGGVSTSWAVQSTARDAHDRDYKVCIVEDICAAANQEEHQSSIQLMEKIAQIVTVSELKGI